MKTAQEIQKDGTGHYRFRKGEIREIMAATKAKKLDDVSYWRRKRGKASK